MCVVTGSQRYTFSVPCECHLCPLSFCSTRSVHGRQMALTFLRDCRKGYIPARIYGTCQYILYFFHVPLYSAKPSLSWPKAAKTLQPDVQTLALSTLPIYDYLCMRKPMRKPMRLHRVTFRGLHSPTSQVKRLRSTGLSRWRVLLQ